MTKLSGAHTHIRTLPLKADCPRQRSAASLPGRLASVRSRDEHTSHNNDIARANAASGLGRGQIERREGGSGWGQPVLCFLISWNSKYIDHASGSIDE
jgi:hypothetical protein